MPASSATSASRSAGDSWHLAFPQTTDVEEIVGHRRDDAHRLQCGAELAALSFKKLR